MPDDPSDRYVTSILRPQPQTAGLNSRQQSIVVSDARHRLNSLLTHWHDSPFRRTALLLGVEEASFYEPATVDLDIRSMVVVGVRNSLVEDLGARLTGNSGTNHTPSGNYRFRHEVAYHRCH